MNDFNDQYRQLVQSAPAGIFHTCEKGLYTYCNQAWQDTFQLSLDDAKDIGWKRRIHPQDKHQVISQWEETITSKHVFCAQFKLQLPSGKIRYIQCEANPIKNNQGEVTGYVGVIQDISQKKITEHHLIESEGRARAIIEQSRIPYAVRAINDDVVYLNPAFENTFGYNRDDINKVSDWHNKAYPNKRYREKILTQWDKKIAEVEKDNS